MTASTPVSGPRPRARKPETRQLQALLTLVDAGSVTAAARALGLAQSTVSEALAALERTLGTRLVSRRRGSRVVGLTSAGRALLPHARDVLSSLEAARQAVAAASREARGSLDVIANESIGTYLLPRALVVLSDRWPNVRFAVSVATGQGVRDGVASGAFDVGLWLHADAPAPRVVFERGPSATGVSLAKVSLVLFAGPGHPLRPGTGSAPVTRDQLDGYSVFVTDAAGDFHALLRRFFMTDGMPGPRLEPTGTIESVKRSVSANPLALGVLPRFALAEELRDGRLSALAVRPSLPAVRIEALLCGGRPVLPAAHELLAALGAPLGLTLPAMAGARPPATRGCPGA